VGRGSVVGLKTRDGAMRGGIGRGLGTFEDSASGIGNRRALGRWELLSWLNDFLCLDQSKVEECADGVAFCQLLDAVFPGKIPLHKLVWDARGTDDRMKNLRILEKVMRECSMSKPIQAEKIASGSFPENLALLQFLHTFIQRNCPGDRAMPKSCLFWSVRPLEGRCNTLRCDDAILHPPHTRTDQERTCNTTLTSGGRRQWDTLACELARSFPLPSLMGCRKVTHSGPCVRACVRACLPARLRACARA
jgi:hypothetical protein